MELSLSHLVLAVLGLLGGGLGTFLINFYSSKRDKDLASNQQEATQKLAADDKAISAYEKLFETILQWSNKCDKNNELIMEGMNKVSDGMNRMSIKLDDLVSVIKTGK